MKQDQMKPGIKTANKNGPTGAGFKGTAINVFKKINEVMNNFDSKIYKRNQGPLGGAVG